MQLKRPLAFIDLEATGVDTVNDRIVEIGIVLLDLEGQETEHRYLVNPTCPIPQEASMIHGIKDEDVANCPTFKEIAQELFDLLNPCDFAGFSSNNYDIPLLAEEFLRADLVLSFKDRSLIDVRNIFVLKEKRDLASAYKFYCDQEIVNAHTAMADIRATKDVFFAQLKKYEDLPESIEKLHNYSNQHQLNRIDFAGRFVMRKGEATFNFGKHKGRPVREVLVNEPGYYAWMMKNDFPRDTKMRLKEIKLSMNSF